MTAPLTSTDKGRGAVFLAEDDPSLRNLLEVAIRHAGHDVVACNSGSHLLQRLLQYAADHERPPALVISDHRMPGPAGIEIVEVVRGWGWAVPFVLITAFPDDELLDRAARSGVDMVLSKPVSLPDLLATIEAHVARPEPLDPIACVSCGEVAVTRDRAIERGVGFCADCEPTGRYRAGRGFDDVYVDLGGSG